MKGTELSPEERARRAKEAQEGRARLLVLTAAAALESLDELADMTHVALWDEERAIIDAARSLCARLSNQGER